jgi:hypothetical protein
MLAISKTCLKSLQNNFTFVFLSSPQSKISVVGLLLSDEYSLTHSPCDQTDTLSHSPCDQTDTLSHSPCEQTDSYIQTDTHSNFLPIVTPILDRDTEYKTKFGYCENYIKEDNVNNVDLEHECESVSVWSHGECESVSVSSYDVGKYMCLSVCLQNNFTFVFLSSPQSKISVVGLLLSDEYSLIFLWCHNTNPGYQV